MPRITHFEIHADDPQRAIKFYSSLFGWKFENWPGPMDYWLITTGSKEEPGIDGGLVKRQGGTGDKVIAYVCTLNVSNLDDLVAKVSKSGGAIAVPKMPIPTVGWLVYCTDTEGNIFGMMQADTTAK